MSYRLITKATFTIANNERQADVRAYAAPKGASVGEITLNGNSAPFKLTGGQGRSTVVRCYMYFPYNGESAYIEITKDELNELKAGNHATLFTITVVESHAKDEAARAAPAAPAAPAVEEVEAPKAKRTRKVAA